MPDAPEIEYAARPADDPVARLNQKIGTGEITLKFEGSSGYLRSVLSALNIPAESQIQVFSKTGIQGFRTSPKNARRLFFNDTVVVGWVPGGLLEFAAQDPQQGMVFYLLQQTPQSSPNITRQNQCLSCHDSNAAGGVPGALLRSVVTASDGTAMTQFGEAVVDHRTPFKERWGGWYVTGEVGSNSHMGNRVATNPPKDIAGPARFASVSLPPGTEFPTPSSDVVALMVFEHQMHMMNLITRFGWDLRGAQWERERGAPPGTIAKALDDDVNELVDYMLFVDEAPIPKTIRGTSGFAELFSSIGPRDHSGRSLRDLDLRRRLLRYPCSYMIYSEAFDSLLPQGREMIYRRMWRVLSGQERAAKYSSLSYTDRKNIAAILIQTKKGLPEYFQVPTS